MDLGNFSVSLAVSDINASRKFYEAIGFEVIGGEVEQNWLILQCGSTKIGLFQDMFDRNILTFNPKDVRTIQEALKAEGLRFVEEAEDAAEGPASAMLIDPDGNPILFDQLE